MRKVLFWSFILLLTGCAATKYKDPVVLDVSDFKVVIQVESAQQGRAVRSGFFGHSFAPINVEKKAAQTCAQFSRKASLLSKSCGKHVRTKISGMCYAVNYLFACVE